MGSIAVRDLVLFGASCVLAFALPRKTFEKLCVGVLIAIALFWGYRWIF